MSIRSLDLLDLPFLSRYRQDVLVLDTGRMLTRGNPIGTRAMLSYLNPSRQIYTAVASGEGDTLMGQVILKAEERSARLTFLAPAGKINGLTLPLLEDLTRQAGEWGALYLLAEVDEESPAFKILRQAGFAMYGWQRAWKLPQLKGTAAESGWREVDELEWHAVQSLHGQIVPALLQTIETLPKEASGLVCRPEENLQAYTSVDSGTHGIWLQPLMPPDSTCAAQQLLELLSIIPGAGRLPVYMCVRSYQAWLEASLEELGAEAGERQAILYKRLAVNVKEAQSIPVLEKGLAKVKPTASVTHIVETSNPKQDG